METGRIEELKNLRKIVDEENARKDEKPLLDIEKGVNEMNYFYKTLTDDDLFMEVRSAT